ncbi:sulfite reductase subunit alpha [Falsiroseomonas selenitidurans]|uniref:NADPH--hemoprotein reductase n=1 Tax=Falsiroseomonas selenitidurans TaxID=2716335 RepID=A0ABX1E7Q2_9PROT|nr:sulfite reductase flavoprotein subunit alpha [Falsiroseomonas selenitidurans]NKC31552.1 sulfite reductase flavoprotein subunit alpha [Falsiroseomonas selenitidurans]
MPRLLAALALVLLWLALCAGILWRERRRRRARAAQSDAAPAVLVVHASQTGLAETLARRSAESLRAGGLPVALAALGALDSAALAGAGSALFVVSTTGEGDAPDSAGRFLRRVMPAAPDLAGLRYGVLALGDRSYAQFCAFGRQLDAWLRQHGATPLFDRVEVDDGDAAALHHWQDHLGRLAGVDALPDWAPARFEPWRLVERRLLNPGSPGGQAWHLALRPPAGMRPDWQAGDIAEIGPRNPPAAVAAFTARLGRGALPGLDSRLLPEDPAAIAALRGLPDPVAALPAPPHRAYSIASLPASGQVELLVRLVRRADGRPGLGSGWLALHAPLGGAVALRLRRNAAFHPPAATRPLILIGNGTGLAGLRAHLLARRAAGARPNWLLFGERTRAHDLFHGAEIAGWRADGTLARLDLAFSRDAADGAHVQDRLRQAAPELRRWVDDGAAILVCGSRQGMAAGVQAVLVEVLGAAVVEALSEAGRYRRDVY